MPSGTVLNKRKAFTRLARSHRQRTTALGALVGAHRLLHLLRPQQHKPNHVNQSLTRTPRVHARIKRWAIGSFAALARTLTASPCLSTTILGFFVFVLSSSSVTKAAVRFLITIGISLRLSGLSPCGKRRFSTQILKHSLSFCSLPLVIISKVEPSHPKVEPHSYGTPVNVRQRCRRMGYTAPKRPYAITPKYHLAIHARRQVPSETRAP